ncbi:hypothetical protein LPJ77_003024 [Coemansia sp. RSA 2523]|nr:hypothetical protein LPJ77_003024 [Coemansia sp. RSA 2523]
MHDYRPTTFVSPTYCELCSGFLWGVSKQGVQCNKCSQTAHKSCAFDAITKCVGDRGLAVLVTKGDNMRPDSSTESAVAFGAEAGRDSEYARRLDRMFWQQVDEETRLNDLASMQAEQPLSLFQTLPANFIQFTAKLAPLTLLLRGATDIVFWRQPRRTVAAMCIYSMYCLRPNLLMATPLALAIAYILFTFFNSTYSREEVNNSLALSTGVQTLPRRLGSGLFSIVPLGGSSASTAVEPAQKPGNSGSHLRGRLRERRRGLQSNPYPQISTSDRGSNVTQQDEPVWSHDETSLPPRMSADASEQSFTEQRRRSSSAVLMGSHVSSDAQTPAHTGSAPSSPKPRVLVRALSNGEPTPRKKAASKEPTDLGALLGVAGFGSARYTENVHATQTMTGTYVSLYDWIAAHNHLVDWSEPAEARRILEACICAQVAVLVIVYWVPWYLLFLAGGNAGLLSMSPHVRAVCKIYGIEFALYVHQCVLVRWNYFQHRFAKIAVVRWTRAVVRWWSIRRASSRATHGTQFTSPGLLAQDSDDEDAINTANEARSGYITPPSLLSLSSTAGSSGSTLIRRTQMVSVFENQRWWLGFGWIPRLGSNERAKWSDEQGKRRYASIRDFMPEDGYEWADEGSGWEVDRRWALPVCTDEDGWVYSDNFWRRPASAPSAMSSYTRRRRWMRRVRPVHRSDITRAASGTL